MDIEDADDHHTNNAYGGDTSLRGRSSELPPVATFRNIITEYNNKRQKYAHCRRATRSNTQQDYNANESDQGRSGNSGAGKYDKLENNIIKNNISLVFGPVKK